MKILIRYLYFVNIVAFVYCVHLKTEQGEIKGQIERSRKGREFYAFYGIPYAQPPIEELRFEDPIPAKPWKGILDATVLPPPCIFSVSGTIVGEEDCLYLNLYTPDISKTTKLPVIVFIYGGRYMYGDALPSKYGAHYFMDEDVILITFHYRQGTLGFLTTEDETMPGNYGLKDFVAVLRWIRENIHSFGGDKDRVTIAGGSSGAQMASLALVSPLTEGLFHRCISQSGTLLEIDLLLDRKSDTWKIASLVGCSTNLTTSQQLKSCLKKVPAADLALTNEQLFTFGHLSPGLPFGPVVENEKIPGAFLVDRPSTLLKRKSNIPWLMGMNSEDGAMFTIFTYYNSDPAYNVGKMLKENYCKYMPQVINFGLGTKFRQIEKDCKLTEMIKKKYFGDGELENPRAFTTLQTDTLSFVLKRSLDLYKGPKFVYLYEHRNKESFASTYGAPKDLNLGVIHGDELISQFNWSSQITPIVDGVDLFVSEQIINLWTNFAAYGNPNGNGKVIWKPVTSSNNIEYLHIKNENFEMKTNLMKSIDYDFWNNIFGSSR